MQDEPHTQRIAALDGWRGIAILMVLVFHYFGSPTVHPPTHNYLVHLAALGWGGVDLFFVLSGFLIGGILLDHLRSPSYYKTFYLRRACRILPPYLLTALMLEPTIRHLGLPNTPWYAYAFTANITYAFGTIWIGMSHIWSLSAEEQFYALLPPLLRLNERAVPIIASAVLILSPGIRFFEWRRFGYLGARFLPFGHMDGLFAGVLIAYLMRRAPHLLRRARPFLAWSAAMTTSVLLVFAGLGWTDRELPIAVAGYSLFAVLFSSLIILTILAPERWRWLCDPQLARIGRHSYTIYLLHYPIFWMVVAFFPPLAVAVSATVSFGLAALSWRFFESRAVAFGHAFKYEREDTRAYAMPCDR